MLVLLVGAGDAPALAHEHGVVVLCGAINDGPTLLAWAADHATELGSSGDPTTWLVTAPRHS